MKKEISYPALRIALLYLLFGGLWVALSDRLLFLLFPDPATLTMFQTYKGEFFVLASTLLLYTSVRRELKARLRLEQSLEQARNQAQRYLDIAAVIMVVIDTDQRVRLINKRGLDILGYRPDEEAELLGRDWFEAVIPPRYRGTMRALFKRLVSGQETVVEYTESAVMTRGGGERMIAWHNTAITDEDGRIIGMLASGDDITEQKQAEAKIQRHLKQLGALRTIDMSITSSLDLRVTLNVFLDQVLTQLGVDAADVLLTNHGQRLEYAAGRGFLYRDVEHSDLYIGEGVAGRAALERRTISILGREEMQEKLVRFPLIAKEGFVSYYGVPLIAKGQVKGVLELFHRSPLTPDNEWLEFLDALASQASIAIDNAELYEDLQSANVELNVAYDATLEGWGRTLEMRDVVTEGHTRRVADMTVRLARAMGLKDSDLVNIRRGALLHDVGKIGIPDRILLKPGPLNAEEWKVMRMHPVYAFELLRHIPYLKYAIDIPYCHHERWDGSGYPRGLKGEQIPLAARIFSVVDVWDAVRSDRPYHPAWPEEEARRYIGSLAGTQLCPRTVEVFLSMEWAPPPAVSVPEQD
ncbi:MAG: HD domain-containing phosphohydrolase [Nitrospirota bacterium]